MASELPAAAGADVAASADREHARSADQTTTAYFLFNLRYQLPHISYSTASLNPHHPREAVLAALKPPLQHTIHLDNDITLRLTRKGIKTPRRAHLLEITLDIQR